MTYTVKTFSEEFIEKQVEIGQKAYEGWSGAGQTSVENLKNTYNKENPNFDPETKLYAFKRNEMVGFVTATLQEKKENEPLTARLEFPLVLPGDESAREILISTAFEKLKSKGVEKVLSRAGPKWGYTLDFVDKYQYNLSNKLSKSAEFDINDIDTSNFPTTTEVEKFDREVDTEPLLEAFKEFYSITDENQIENLRNQVNNLPNIVNIIDENVVKSGDKIVGRQLVYTQNSDIILFGTLLVVGENKEEIERKLLAASVNSVKQSELSKCRVVLFGNLEENEKKYSMFGIKFVDELGMYEKKL